MFSFAKTKKNPGWLAINIQVDGIYAIHVWRAPSEKPVVELASFFPSDAAATRPALEKLAKDLNAGRYQCTTILASGEYQLLTVEAPNVPPDELKTAVRWRLKDILDFHIEDATIDVLDVPADKNAATRNHSMYAVAARNQLIKERQEMFGAAKIPLSVIDIQEMAQRNISALLAEEGRGLAFLSFGAQGGLLTVTYAGELYLSRRIDVPLAQLQQEDEAQRNACFDRITLELQRSLDHFDRQYHFIAVSRLTLSPLGDAGQRLRDYLSTNLYVPVEVADLSSILDFSKVPELNQTEAQQRYLMTLGAALRLEETAL
jgi:MSHA biogenesis protein MshI